MVETSTALNICQYLLLKAESASKKAAATDGADGEQAMLETGLLGGSPDEDDVRGHPVIERLNQLNDLAQKLSADVADKVPGMDEQVSSLVKAAALVKNGEDDDDEDVASDSETEEGDQTSSSEINTNDVADMHTADSDEDSEESSDDDEDAVRRRVVTEAKFALRSQDIEAEGGRKGSKSAARARRRAPMSSDFGDEDGAEEAANAAGRNLASTLNAISQRAESKKEKGGAAAAAAPEEEDDDDDSFMRGLGMMDAEFGDASGDDGGSGDDDGDEDRDDELDDGLGDDFYSKIKSKSTAKKDFKKSKYTPAPKYPNVEGEIDGERALGRAIMKNRGLVAHKSKLNRNPRVKKREQYRKALIRRKGAVREVRIDEGHKYGGETTGIKAGVSRSRKLGVR